MGELTRRRLIALDRTELATGISIEPTATEVDRLAKCFGDHLLFEPTHRTFIRVVGQRWIWTRSNIQHWQLSLMSDLSLHPLGSEHLG